MRAVPRPTEAEIADYQWAVTGAYGEAGLAAVMYQTGALGVFDWEADSL